MRKLSLLVALALASSAFAAPVVYDITHPVAVQNAYDMTVTLMNEGGVDFLRVTDIPATYTEGPQLNAGAMGGGYGVFIGDNDTIEFDIRYYQSGESNGIPAYDEDNAYLQFQAAAFTVDQVPVTTVLTASEAAVTADGTWHHVTIDASAISGAQAPMSYFKFWGANGRGSATDYFDITSIVLTPEPASLGLVALGALGLIRRR